MTAQIAETAVLPRVNGRHRNRALASARKCRAIQLKHHVGHQQAAGRVQAQRLVRAEHRRGRQARGVHRVHRVRWVVHVHRVDPYALGSVGRGVLGEQQGAVEVGALDFPRSLAAVAAEMDLPAPA